MGIATLLEGLGFQLRGGGDLALAPELRGESTVLQQIVIKLVRLTLATLLLDAASLVPAAIFFAIVLQRPFLHLQPPVLQILYLLE